MELDVVLQGVKRLVSPTQNGGSILQSLAGNLDSFEAFLQEPAQVELKAALQSTQAALDVPEWEGTSAPESCRDTLILYCRFTVQGLALLCLLDEALRRAQAHDHDTSKQVNSEEQFPSKQQKKKQPLPPAPKALLSPAEEKSINTLLQFIVALGLFPFLLPGAENLLVLKLGKTALQLRKSGGLFTTRARYLYHCCRVLTRVFTTPVIGPSVLTRHLSDVLVVLLQICYGPSDAVAGEQSSVQEKDDSELLKTGGVQKAKDELSGRETRPPVLHATEKEWCREELGRLLGELHQPLVVRELLSLQGAPGKPAGASKTKREGEKKQQAVSATPRWLRSACGRLLSERLMQKDGVRKVLLGIFDAMAGGEGAGPGYHGDWRKAQAVARILSSCPSQASSVAQYYSTIAPQLLELVSSAMVGGVQVAAATISSMMRQQPALARTHLLDPLTQPLRLLTAVAEDQPLTGVETNIEVCVNNLQRLCSAVEPSSLLVLALQPYLPVFFELQRACSGPKKTDNPLRMKVKAVLVCILSSLDSAAALDFLRHLAGMPPAAGSNVDRPVVWLSVSPSVAVQWLPEEDRFSVRCEDDGGEEGRWSVGRMESVGQAMLELVGTEIKSGGLLGEFFLECLTRVAAILCLDVNYEPQLLSIRKEMKSLTLPETTKKSKYASSALLAVEQKMSSPTQREAFHRSLVLYLTAALSENLTAAVLEQTDVAQLLEVLSVVVGCHAHFVTSKQGSPSPSSSSPLNLLVVQPDLGELLGGPITLSIGLGYLSAILGAAEVEKEHRPRLSGLLQPLEALATGYPDAELSALAGDLRVCVATLGAVWSTEVREAAEGGKGGMADKILSGLQRDRDGLERKGAKSSAASVEVGSRGKRNLVEEIPEASPLDCHTAPVETASQRVEDGKKQTEDSPQTAFQRALAEAQDPEIPVKGHGLASLAKLIKAGDGQASVNSLSLLGVFKETLHHTDSYVYLAAISGLVALASKHPREVLETLCREYAMFSDSHSSKVGGRVDKETGQLRRSSGSQEYSRGRDAGQTSKDASLEFRLKLGEALVHAARGCGELLPHYADTLLAAVLSSARDPHPLVRASALSSLAEICRLLGHSFGRIHHEVLSCVSQLVLTDSNPQVQQASLLVLSLLLKGLSRDSVNVLGESLRDIYRLLKQVEGEGGRDELTRTHARAALGELDRVMRDWAFPQQTLSRKITILDHL